MSYFNAEQEAHMKYLSAVPRNKRCWCGWWLVNECHVCPKNVTNAEKCLPCGGIGKRWQDKKYLDCPDCAATGRERTAVTE